MVITAKSWFYYSLLLRNDSESRWSMKPSDVNTVPLYQGNAYDVTNGAFIAPCDGQYFFQLTLNTNQQGDSGYVDGVIEVNNTGKARTSVFTQDLSAHHEQATNGVVVTLKKNDAVQARIQTNSAGEIYGQVWSVFSGFYISP